MLKHREIMKTILFSASVILIAMTACNKSPERGKSADNNLRVLQDTIFTEMFNRDCCGYTGGDGTISVLLPDGRTVWIFGDTFLGAVNPDNTRPKMTPVFIRNSVVVQDGNSVITLHQGTPEHPVSFVVPLLMQTEGLRSLRILYGSGHVMDLSKTINSSCFSRV